LEGIARRGDGVGPVGWIVEASPIISFPNHILSLGYGRAGTLSSFVLVGLGGFFDFGFVSHADPQFEIYNLQLKVMVESLLLWYHGVSSPDLWRLVVNS